MADERGAHLTPIDLAGLDALGLGADSLALFVYDDPRPPGGVADLVDWRLAGRIAQAHAAGHFKAALGAQLLVPGTERLGSVKVFVFGLGPEAQATEASLGGVFAKAVEAVARAGCRRLAVAVPSGHARGTDGAAAVLRACARAEGAHIIAKVLTLKVD